MSMAPEAAARKSAGWPDWSAGLPRELVEFIAKKLPSGQDAAAFRAVCSPWRDALPFASFAPLLVLPFHHVAESPESAAGAVTFYSLTEERAFSLPLPEARGKVTVGSSRGWLAVMDEAASVTLLNPFTGAHVALPPADEHVAVASSRRAAMVGGRWVIHSDAHAAAVRLDEMRDVFFREIVLSSSPPGPGGGCVAMAVLANSTDVAFCRVGVDSEWVLLDANLECCVSSIVHCNGRFLAIGCLGEISIFSSTDIAGATPTATPMPSLLDQPAWLSHRSYLEVNGELHLFGVIVGGFNHKRRRFTYRNVVYKCGDLLGETPAWSKVKDVGDMALFVSKNLKASFCGASVSKFKRNCVYFSEPIYGDQDSLDHHLEMVDIATGSSKLQGYRQKSQGSEAICWIRPNLWT